MKTNFNTHKIRQSIKAATALLAIFVLLPSVVLAAPHKEDFALACRSGPADVSATGQVGCSDANDKARITNVDSSATAQKDNANVAVFTVDCNNSTVKSYKVNDQPSSFKCTNGSSPVVGAISNTPAPAAPATCSSGGTGSCDDPAIKCKDKNCDLIGKYVNPAINLFSTAFGLIAIISIIYGSINYATSEGDPQKSSQAKKRIVNTIFAVVAYIFLYAFLQFLVPGGLFKR